jgi:2-keto-3-deoxy-galactonokinase
MKTHENQRNVEVCLQGVIVGSNVAILRERQTAKSKVSMISSLAMEKELTGHLS